MKTWMVHGPFSLSDSTICAAEFAAAVNLEAEAELDGLFMGTSTDGSNFSGVQLTGIMRETITLDLEQLLGSPQVWIATARIPRPTLTSAEMTFADNIELDFVIPRNGFVGSFAQNSISLVHAGCPPPPLLAATILVSPTSGWVTRKVCLDRCSAISVEDCSGGFHSTNFVGYSDWPLPPCQTETLCGTVVGTEGTSWGNIKGCFRSRSVR